MASKKIFKLITSLSLCFTFFVLPSSSNYSLDGYSLGNAGGANLSSSSYEMAASVGDIDSQNLSGNSYDLAAGLSYVLQANVPMFSSFTNVDGSYDTLHFILDPQSNPSDTKFAIAISSDNFVTTQYVKSDNTVGTSLALTDYQTYTQWGGSSGADIIGLTPNTTYKIKAKAMQGKFTETEYGPFSSASTTNPTLFFDIDTASTDIETSSPYTVDFGELQADVVGTATNKIWIDLETNANSGANAYIYSQNGGLYSTNTAYKIVSFSGNLDVATTGFGIRNETATQTLGYVAAVSPYNVSSNNIGIVDSSIRNLLSSTAPLTGGRASFLLKAKSSLDTPSSSDYTDTYTIIASANF